MFEYSLLRRFDRPSGHYQVNFYPKEINYLLENNKQKFLYECNEIFEN
jgi:hypothetical protein